MALIECKNISVAYDGKNIIKNLSLTVENGDILCIVGENGSGKSTLMKAILGLVKLSAGEIIFNDSSKKGIGYLPQQTDVQRDFPASVREIVLSGCLNKMGLRPFYSKKEKQMAEQNMDLLGISELSDRCYQELSGGQQQRVLLARSLCACEKILILDEPVTGLDPLVTAELYELIERINEEKNISIIMVSHDIEKSVKIGKHILHLNNNSYIFDSTENYINSDYYRFFTGGGLNG